MDTLAGAISAPLSGARPKDSRSRALLSREPKNDTVSPGMSPPLAMSPSVERRFTNGRSSTDPSYLPAGPRRRCRRRAVRVDSGAGAGLQLEAVPGQGALPPADQASVHRRARKEHSRVRVADRNEGEVGDASRDPGTAEDDRRDDGELRRNRRLLHVAPRREEALLESGLVSTDEQVPRGQDAHDHRGGWNDFTPGARAGSTQPDGSISALAAFVDANVVFYRKDLFAAKNATPPKTLADIEPTVQKLHAPPGTYGIVLRGLKNANATQYPSILFQNGGTYLKDGKAALDSKEQIASLDLYAKLLRQYAPPGVVNFNWYECSASFMQGQVAMYMDGVNFASQFEDAAKSKVVGKVGYAVLPSGPGGHFSPIYITGMAVSSQSRNKEAAYLFTQWATSKANMVRELMAGVGVGRTSTWDSAEVKAKPKMPADWYQAYQA